MSDLITKDQLKAILSSAKEENIDRYLAPLNKALAHYAINSALRVAHFIAQVAQESGSFRYNEEIWPNPALDAHGVATNGSSWQLRYEGRAELGNTQPGDGYRFRGRGLIQLTGRANYAKYGAQLGRDLTSGSNPDLVAQPDLAVDAAGWYWDSRGLNAFADKDDVLSITKRINGGTLGLDNRKAFLAKAKGVLGIS
jgi:putative chitinase